MKRNLSIWLGLLSFALVPVLAQTPAAPKGPTGKIHGHVITVTGVAETTGTVSLSNDDGHTLKFTFNVTAAGAYSGEAAPGTYTLVFRLPDTPAGKMVDTIDKVKIIVDQDILQDDDMTRKEFLDTLTSEQKKQLEDVKKQNSVALQANAVIKGLNADILAALQDFKDANAAHAAAKEALGATATPEAISTKEAEIRAAKYTDVETMMLRDTAAKPDAAVLWVQLGQAQVGLKKYDEGEATFKKILELEAAAKKPDASIIGGAQAGLGEIYARSNKAPEANAAYDAAVKANPTQASFYLKNEAVVFFQEHNSDAQAAAAEQAITADPTQALAYYLKGNGLIAKTTVDTKTNKLVAPAGCLEAYQKYIDLAPTGAYVAEVKGILAGFQQTLPTNTPTKKRK